MAIPQLYKNLFGTFNPSGQLSALRSRLQAGKGNPTATLPTQKTIFGKPPVAPPQPEVKATTAIVPPAPTYSAPTPPPTPTLSVPTAPPAPQSVPAQQPTPQPNVQAQLEALTRQAQGIQTGLTNLEQRQQPVEQFRAIQEKITKASAPTSEELTAEEQLRAAQQGFALGEANILDRPIPKIFQTGQLASLARRQAIEEGTLQQRLAALQARRGAELTGAKTELEAEKERRELLKPVEKKTQIVNIGGRQVLIDTQTGETIRDIGGAPISEAQAIKAGEKTEAEKAARSETLGGVQLVNDILQGDPESLTGIGQFFPSLFNAETLNKYNQLKAMLSLENRQKLKGSGAISDFEGRVLDAASSALGRNLSNEAFKRELRRIKGVFQTSAGLQTSVKITDPKTGDSRTVQAGRDGIDQAIADGLNVEYQ